MATGTAQAPDSSTSRTGSRERQINLVGFAGGLNNTSDETSLNDNECTVLENLEPDVNGGLTSRPPIVKLADQPPGGGTGLVDIIGYYIDTSSVTHVVVTLGGVGTFLYNTNTNVYVLMTSVIASGCAQYNNKLYICSATAAGGHWDGGTFTQHNTGLYPMPKGEQITLYKSRFWLISREPASNRSRIFFSRITAAGAPPTSIDEWNVWTGNDFFDVSAGDGQWITKLITGANEIYIFRNQSTYYFKYDSSPLSGRLDLLDAYIGADNSKSVDRYEFSFVVLNNGVLYRFVSYQFYPLNNVQKLRLLPGGAVSSYYIKSSVAVFGRRAMVFYGGIMYVLDLDQGTWSIWNSPSTKLGYLQRAPRPEDLLVPDVAYGVSGSTTTGLHGLYRVRNEINSLDKEEMTAIIRTKAFDFGAPDAWKRLFYWSADVLTQRHIVGIATPIQAQSSYVTWDDMETKTWDELESGTWDEPLLKSSVVTTDRPYSPNAPYRVNVTFAKDMRFRRCAFEVRLSTDGSTGTGAVRLVALSIHATSKQHLPGVVQ